MVLSYFTICVKNETIHDHSIGEVHVCSYCLLMYVKCRALLKSSSLFNFVS